MKKYKILIAIVLVISIGATVLVACKNDPQSGEESLSWTLQSIADSMADANAPGYGSLYPNGNDIVLYVDKANDAPANMPNDVGGDMEDYYKAIKSALGSGYYPDTARGIQSLTATFGIDAAYIKEYIFETCADSKYIDALVIIESDTVENAEKVRTTLLDYRNKTYIDYGMKHNDYIAKINTARVVRAGKFCFLYLLGNDAPASYEGNEIFKYQNEEAEKVYNVIKNIYGKDLI